MSVDINKEDTLTIRQKERFFKLFFLLALLEGIPALIWIYRIPSDLDNAVLLGFSPVRIAFGGLIFLLLLIPAYILVRSIRDDDWFQSRIHSFDHRLENDASLHLAITILVYTSIVGISVLIFFQSPWADLFGPIRAVYQRTLSLTIWATLLSIQAFLLIFFLSYPRWKKRHFILREESYRILWTFLIVTYTIFHWMLLILRDPVLGHFPYWWSSFTIKGYTWRDLLFIIVVCLAFVLLSYILRRPATTKKALLFVVLFGYITQLSFGIIEGNGLDSNFQKFLETSQSQFIRHSGPDLNLIDSIQDYDRKYGPDRVLGTKPPGALTIYILVEKIANWTGPPRMTQERRERQLELAKVGFPILSILSLVVLWFLCRQVLSDQLAALVVFFFAFIPSFVLKQYQLDQFLYPTLFLVGVLLAWLSIRRGSFWLGFCTGAYAFIAVFFSFSLLPIIAFAAFLVALFLWSGFKDRTWQRLIPVGIGFLLGMMMTGALFYVGLDYDPFHRYAWAMDSHQIQKRYQPGLEQILLAGIQNTIEFAFWVGIPILFLTFSRLIRSIHRFLIRSFENIDLLALAFFGVFVSLNLLGSTRGEVGRLWIFLVPFFVLLTVDEVVQLYKNDQNRAFYILLASQLTTLYLLFKFADRI